MGAIGPPFSDYSSQTWGSGPVQRYGGWQISVVKEDAICARIVSASGVFRCCVQAFAVQHLHYVVCLCHRDLRATERQNM